MLRKPPANVRVSVRAVARRSPRTARIVATTGFLVALAMIVAAPSRAMEETRSFSFDSRHLSVASLVGSVEIVEGQGNSFKVTAHVRGKDSGAATVDFVEKDGSKARLLVNFPVDKHRKYVYPDYNGNTTLRKNYGDSSSSLLGRLLGTLTSDDVKVSGRGSGLHLWVDLLIEVPAGARLLAVENGVGDIVAHGVDADLHLTSRSGKLTGSQLKGDSVFDLGSGTVRLSDCEGELTIDTGSGSVSLDRFQGPSLSIDTGSGRVSLADIRTRHLHVDTGSGGVGAEKIAAEDATIDTGSGHVRLALTEMGAGDFSIDSGSGGITLLLPAYASASISAETGSGGIDVALEGIKLLHRERNEMRFEIGKGETKVKLDTGSGRIRIASVDP